MKRFSWKEMQEYWGLNDARYAGFDRDRDPEGLGVILQVEAPLWFNRYYARFQALTFKKLFARIPRPARIARALDIGCGAGRWCRLLAERGYQTVGIDLQARLIEQNRRRYPRITFLRTPVQEYNPEAGFDVVTSVTVIQHVPFEEQDAVIHKLRMLLNAGRYALVLENVRDQNPHVFSNSIEGWRTRFQQAGFRTLAIQRYDYSPILRFRAWLAESIMVGLRRSTAGETPLTPEALLSQWDRRSPQGAVLRALRGMDYFFRRAAVASDSLIEPLLVAGNVSLPTVHCGFLFQTV